jgi:hypothetical protein
MSGPITDALVADHHRLGAWLQQALRGDRDAYVAFRGALLRHIGIEEKLLLPALRARGIEPTVAGQLRLDHGALAALLVPSPTPAILTEMQALLTLHDPLEEGPGGLYPLADEALADPSELLGRISGAPYPPLAVHYDGARAFAAIERLLARARQGRQDSARAHLQSAPPAAHLPGKR